jgi:hypothetical protein
MKLQRRLEALEAGLITEPTVLRMTDGSIANISGQADRLLQLFEIAVGGESINPQDAADLDLIRRSTGSRQPDGGHITDLIHCFMH